MKKSEFKAYLREEIISVLSEADPEDIKAQQDLNKELDLTKQKADELGQSLSEEDEELMKENLNPEVIKAVNLFIKRMAKRYGYSEQDAIFAIEQALEKIQPSTPTDIPGFEGTMDDLDNINIREEEDDDDEMDKKASSAAKKGDSVSKIANKLGETTNEMKKLAKKYKDTKEPEKTRLLTRLKELTKIKKELEGLL